MMDGLDRLQPGIPPCHDLGRRDLFRRPSAQRRHVEEHARRKEALDQRPVPVVGADEKLVDRFDDPGAIYQRLQFSIHLAIFDLDSILRASSAARTLSKLRLSLSLYRAVVQTSVSQNSWTVNSPKRGRMAQ